MEVTILDPNPYGPLSEERLEAFERRIGATLPPDYRAFLLRYNGGQPQPGDVGAAAAGSYGGGTRAQSETPAQR